MERLALVIVESGSGIVLVHPPGGPPEAPASLPSGVVLDGETEEAAAVRLVREQTGLEVVLHERLIAFEQEGTPYGTAAMTGFVGRAVSGELREGSEGAPVVYALDELPAIIPARLANQRVLDAYLAGQRKTGTFLGVPYDWRRPTLARAKSRWWNPNEPRIFTPRTFGWGYDINVARVLGRRPKT